jgi:phosphoribosylanthranilate isomerase
MHRTRIKICGITRVEDALAAARHGADAIGLVMHREAKRHVTIAQARQVIAALPPFVTPVALFVDAPTQEIVETARELGVRHVQLHGHELPDEIAPLAPLRVIKAVRVTRMGLRDVVRRWRGVADNLVGIVLETASAKGGGGTGVANDWDFIEAATKAGDLKGLPNIIAAGGLTPETVADVVRRIQPWAVDVSSGVEISLGIKSESKIEAFCRAVASVPSPSGRGANTSASTTSSPSSPLDEG